MAQQNDPKLLRLKVEIEMGLRQDFGVHLDGTLRFQDGLCVLEDPDLEEENFGRST